MKNLKNVENSSWNEFIESLTQTKKVKDSVALLGNVKNEKLKSIDFQEFNNFKKDESNEYCFRKFLDSSATKVLFQFKDEVSSLDKKGSVSKIQLEKNKIFLIDYDGYVLIYLVK